MKCLSIRQPWAWAIIHTGTDVENRSWITRHRGPLLIHSGISLDTQWESACELIQSVSGLVVPPKSEMLRGGIVGAADLVDVASEFEGEAFDSPWWLGPCGLLLANQRALPFFPLRGQLGLFEAPSEALTANVSLVSRVA